MAKDVRKPVRRDPEKRRQQNMRAQKKYREFLSSLKSACYQPRDRGH